MPTGFPQQSQASVCLYFPVMSRSLKVFFSAVVVVMYQAYISIPALSTVLGK